MFTVDVRPKLKFKKFLFWDEGHMLRQWLSSRGRTSHHDESFHHYSVERGRHDVLKPEASALADDSFCFVLIVVVVVILHRLFLCSKVVKLACF